jgi:glycosyltransferase involved in cell wall biosynthesis
MAHASDFIYITTARLPNQRAHGVQIMKMCEALGAHTENLTLIAPNRSNTLGRDPFEYYGINETFSIEKVPIIEAAPHGRLGYWLQVATFTLSAWWRLRAHSPRIVYGRDPIPLLWLALIGYTCVWEVHTKERATLVRWLAPRCAQVFAISNGLREYCLEVATLNSEKVSVLPDGVDMAPFERVRSESQSALRDRLGLPRDKQLVGYVGKYRTMGNSKGVDEIVTAVAKVREEQADVALLIVGLSEREQDELAAVCSKEGIPPSAYVLIQHVQHEEAVAYMVASDVLVMNYPHTEHYAKYMSPMKLFEYMASGTPIVSSDLPAVREVLNENCAFLYTPENSVDLSAAIGEATQNREMAHRYARNALDEVRHYSWHTRASKITDSTDLRNDPATQGSTYQ